ncbi:MAG: hypothetical protein WAM60_18200 [Candidatus Promineifilaceae bacterium]
MASTGSGKDEPISFQPETQGANAIDWVVLKTIYQIVLLGVNDFKRGEVVDDFGRFGADGYDLFDEAEDVGFVVGVVGDAAALDEKGLTPGVYFFVEAYLF